LWLWIFKNRVLEQLVLADTVLEQLVLIELVLPTVTPCFEGLNEGNISEHKP
jgi:hypothetical protein